MSRSLPGGGGGGSRGFDDESEPGHVLGNFGVKLLKKAVVFSSCSQRDISDIKCVEI